MSAPRVVIADDHPMFRFGLRSALAATPEVEVVGEAADGAELRALVDELRPDVVLTDLEMPREGGLEMLRRLAERDGAPGVLVLTMHADDDALLDAVRAGARGYLLKGADRDEIVRAVQTVAGGGSVFSGEVGRRVAAYATRPPSNGRVFPELTEREHEVLEHVAVGRGNHEIAARLSLSEKTVRNHVSIVLTKLQVRDRAAAVAKARDRGLGPPVD
ncbi:response regulator [Agromyces mangrovi Wang et al. 2018]|uniref:response regulator n=1 Tax=Agromyces mangrovi TaxID=1858653 RepID=UPI0025740E13|nr:response regulator transcription factor [Agromyces mangrovi]BDZ65396.1 DNA-binding response regulator [Agromyces mangrovi]